jgi:probable HAF family extracellular repeat protein
MFTTDWSIVNGKIMKTNHRIIRWLALLLLALNPRPSLVFAQSYDIVDLGTLGRVGATAYGINNSGQVVGQATTSRNYAHAFVYSGGSMADLGTLAGNGSFAEDINNNGQVVGTTGASHAFLYSGGTMLDLTPTTNGQAFGINDYGQVVGYAAGRAFLYSGGMMKDLGTLGGLSAQAFDINNNGQVVGQAQTSSLAEHAFLYSGGMMKDLGTLPESYTSEAHGINSNGQVVGWCSNLGSPDDHSFLYSGGAMKDLGTLGGSGPTWAFAINDSGQVVGRSTTPSNGSHAFLYGNGSMVDLNTLISTNSGWVISSANDINNSGQIAAVGVFNGSSSSHALLLEPIPEPATCALFALASLVFFLPASVFQHRTKRLWQ